MYSYLRDHKANYYLPSETLLPSLKKYTNRAGWDDFYIGRTLIFSHRLNCYELTNFPEKIHAHSFFEMDIYINGNISYIADNHEIFPDKYDIVIIPPGIFHTGRLSEKSHYERIVIYFDLEQFDVFSRNSLPPIFNSKNAICRSIDAEKKGIFFICWKRPNIPCDRKKRNLGYLLSAISYNYLVLLINILHSI